MNPLVIRDGQVYRKVISSEITHWRDLVKYDQYVQHHIIELLDVLQSLLPISEGLSKYDKLGSWLDDAVDQGLITQRERMAIRRDLAQQL